jgi:hypothetical protein
MITSLDNLALAAVQENTTIEHLIQINEMKEITLKISWPKSLPRRTPPPNYSASSPKLVSKPQDPPRQGEATTAAAAAAAAAPPPSTIQTATVGHMDTKSPKTTTAKLAKLESRGIRKA